MDLVICRLIGALGRIGALLVNQFVELVRAL